MKQYLRSKLIKCGINFVFAVLINVGICTNGYLLRDKIKRMGGTKA